MRLPSWVAITAAVAGVGVFAGCSTASLVLTAAGVATDTSITWEVVKHLHGKLTEGDDKPCVLLDSVERALTPRCGEFVPGSLKAKDMARYAKGECALTMAARDTRLWPVLPELLAKGAQVSACSRSPVVELAQVNDCPDISPQPPDVQGALLSLTQADPRAVHHDVVRWLSCPNSRSAGLDLTLEAWLANGALKPGSLSFSPLGALHPGYLESNFSRALEALGYTAQGALGAYTGHRPPGFEVALRGSHWVALEWWFARVPNLANSVPPVQGNQLPWLPLARVLQPNFLADPDSRGDMVNFLIARGANPEQRLPANPAQTVAGLARAMKSPLAGTLAAASGGTTAPPRELLANTR